MGFEYPQPSTCLHLLIARAATLCTHSSVLHCIFTAIEYAALRSVRPPLEVYLKRKDISSLY